MRITSGSYYNNIYGENNKLSQQLFDVNKQISSGQKIQYANEDPGIFIDTLRLDDEITTLTQVRSSSQNAYKMTTQTDATIGDIVKTLESIKVKMVNAASGTQSNASMQAIAQELRGLQTHLMTLANTSVGGQYLFSGTDTSQKPVAADGTYLGNDQNMEAFLGSGVKQKYNISGAQLFLGNESQVPRKVTTNIDQKSLTDLYPDIMLDPTVSRNTAKETFITGSNTIRDLMGDTDADTTNDAGKTAYFYIQGTRTDGTAFKTQVPMAMTDSVDDLLHKIALAYDPNQLNPTTDQVDISLNAHGQIEISDKQNGSSKLDFHMVGAVDFDPAGADTANVPNIDSLQTGTSDFTNVIDFAYPPVPANPNANALYIKEFTKSGFSTPVTVPNTIQGINYDRTNFVQNGAKLTSNVPQIVTSDNSYATNSTRLGAVASGATYDPINDRYTGLNGQVIKLTGIGTNNVPYDVSINLADAGSTVTGTVNGAAVNFDIKDATDVITDAGKMTYRQMMDVVNMVVTNNIPTGAPGDYATKILAANALGSVNLDYAGRITFEDKKAPVTQANISLYDASSSDYTITTGAALTFNANNALTIRDPKKDFFAQLEQTIRSVEEDKIRADGSDTFDPRNIGIQNSIQMIDDLSDHVSRVQTEVGSYSQVFQATSDRTDLLIINTKQLQSDVIDTDIAEATLRMQQLNLNYQALLSNISKVSKLSLVNYL